MDFFLPFQLAFKTPIGQFFFFLSVLLAFLTSFFFFLKYRINQEANPLSLAEPYFQNRQPKTPDFIHVGPAKQVFLGREYLVEHTKYGPGILRDYFPSLLNSQSQLLFDSYEQKLKKLGVASPYSWTQRDEGLQCFESLSFTPEGLRHTPLKEALANGQLSSQDKEALLIDLAKQLEFIHQSLGSFHGFLQMDNIYLSFEKHRFVKPCFITETAIYPSLDPQAFYQHYLQVKNGELKLGCEDFVFSLRLAPEMLKAPFDVGPATDIYLFASLALFVFSHSNISSPENWEKVPLAWQGFLQQALDKDSSKRPQSFDKLWQWVQQPELNLVFEAIDSPEVSKKLDHMIKKPKESKDNERAYAQKFFDLSQWKLAKKAYLNLLTAYPEDSLALTNLAICYFEMKEYDLAREYYNQAKALKPDEARRYREHILA